MTATSPDLRGRLASTHFVPGYHFLQTPGPTNVPGRVLRAMSAPTIDHRGFAFAELTFGVLEGMQEVLRTRQPVVMFPSSGTGAWEAALVNTMSPGARILAFDRGYFARGWATVARRLGFDVELIAGDWRQPVSDSELERRLSADELQEVSAIMVVHNETSTGVVADIPRCREALDRSGHPALLLVDTVSSLGSLDYRHDDWRVDVTVGSSQKGLLLPPGLGFNAVSEKALSAAQRARSPRSYWDWMPVVEANSRGQFPYTPPTNLLMGLKEALAMLREEGLDAVYARHQRHGRATRQAVAAWGLETVCQHVGSHSGVLTGVMVPEGSDERHIRSTILDRYGVSLGAGLGELEGKAFRIGHLGDFNDAMLIGTLGAVELGLNAAGVAEPGRGVAAAMECLASEPA
jgi:alanine-glyoxylate transaminase / serine-glyoxylate transaminase / serine-pyruvate transaminase